MDLPEIRRPRKRRKDPLEKDIERKVSEHGKSIGIPSMKFTSPNYRSVPDRIFFLGQGIVKFIEFKRAGEKPTAAQVREHDRLRNMGYDVAVVDSVNLGIYVLEAWLRERVR